MNRNLLPACAVLLIRLHLDLQTRLMAGFFMPTGCRYRRYGHPAALAERSPCTAYALRINRAGGRPLLQVCPLSAQERSPDRDALRIDRAGGSAAPTVFLFALVGAVSWPRCVPDNRAVGSAPTGVSVGCRSGLLTAMRFVFHTGANLRNPVQVLLDRLHAASSSCRASSCCRAHRRA